MQTYQVNLCGFEKEYLQQLSLFLKKRMGNRIRVGLWDHVPDGEMGSRAGPDPDRSVIWLGGRDQIDRLRAGEERDLSKPAGSAYLVLGKERAQDRADEVYAYQSADVILDFILRRADLLRRVEPAKQKALLRVETLIDVCDRRRLLSCGMVYAQDMGMGGRVLLLDLMPVSGLMSLFGLDPARMDFADLILALRRGDQVFPADCVMRLENVDLLPAAGNPMVLNQLSDTDLSALFSGIADCRQYDAVLVLLGASIPAASTLFSASAHVWCLQDTGVVSKCRQEGLYAFYLHCGGDPERWKNISLADPAAKTEAGSHLLYEWRADPAVESMRAQMGEL